MANKGIMSRGFYVNMKIPELSNVLKDFAKYDEASQNKLRSAVRGTTKNIMTGTIRRAGSIVKVRTGNLMKGIGMDYNNTTNIGQVKAKSPHAHLIEFGHKGRTAAPAYPILRPSFEQEKPNFIKDVTNAVKP